MEITKMGKNNLKFGFIITLTLLKNRGEISYSQIKSIPFIDREEAELIYQELLSSPSVSINKEKISSEPYLEFDRIITLKNNFN